MPFGPWGSHAHNGTTPVMLEGVEETLRDIERRCAKATNLSNPFQILSGYWVKRQEAVFADGQGSWVPLSSSTIRQKNSRRILVETGIMKDGMTNLRPRFVARTGRFAAYGPPHYDRRAYNPAILSQVGTVRQPKRVVVPRLTTSEKAAWVRVINDYVSKTVTSK